MYPTLAKPLLVMIFSVCCLGQAILAQAKDSQSREELRLMAANYEHGRGVSKSYDKAYRYYCLAALRGDADASYQLGWMYFNGRGVDKNDALAKGWFQRAQKLGDTHAANMLRHLEQNQARPDSSCGLRNPGRRQIEKWVKQWAPEYGLEAELVLAVIAAESNFNANARSHKGALGLMQLIPATARRFGVDNPLDPAQNMHGGMAYLQWLLDYFDGNVQLALAGYNAGERAVERYRGIPPYRETRHYVRRIAQQYPKSTHPVQNLN